MDTNSDFNLKERIQHVWADCPDKVIKLFIEFWLTPSEQLRANAVVTLKKPYGKNHILVDSGEYGLSFAEMEPSQSTSLHYHTTRREFFCVRKGRLLLTKGKTTTTLEAGESNVSIPLEPHSIANTGSEVLELFEIFSPALLNDKTRLKDRYERKLGIVTFDE